MKTMNDLTFLERQELLKTNIQVTLYIIYIIYMIICVTQDEKFFNLFRPFEIMLEKR